MMSPIEFPDRGSSEHLQPSDDKLAAALDSAAQNIRNEPIDTEAETQATSRVWARISSELGNTHAGAIHSCADFQALLPDYQAGRLSEARRLLVKDHLHECIACRRVYMGTAANAGKTQRPSARLARPVRWAVAAALAIGAGLGGWYVFQQFGPMSSAPTATVASVNGALFRMVDGAAVELKAGAPIQAGEQIRVAKDTNATIRLRDGSAIETRERSDFSISETKTDVTVRLARGSVIVEAAKRRSGHLYVSTPDCRVAVTGTVFSVNSGLKGSRVSVIEGEVQVNHGGQEKVLHAGQQYASSNMLAQVPVAQEIAWSKKADEHLALLQEFKKLGEAMDKQVQLPDARYSSALLKYLPAETAVYGAIPNLGETLAQAKQVFEQRLQDSPALRQWWEARGNNNSGKTPQEIVDEIRLLSGYVGDEIVIAAALDKESKLGDPVVLAEVKKSGFAEFLKSEVSKLGGGNVRIIQSAAAIPTTTSKELLVYTNSKIVAISSGAGMLATVAASIEGRGAGTLSGTAFHSQIADAYRDGVGMLFCADLERIIQPAGDKEPGKQELLGNIGRLVVSQKTVAGKPDTHAVLTFRGSRQGVASWLATPAPNGALDFVSPDATIVWAFVAKNLPQVIDELAAKLPGFTDQIGKAEKELGISVRNDLAAALGGEFVFAWDGPAVPVPSWKAVAEVNNQGTLQSTLQTLVNSLNHLAAKDGKPALKYSQEVVGGKTYYTISSEAFKPFSEVHYVFVDSYLVMAPSRALLDKAVQNRGAGNVLASSPKFTSLLPRDTQPNFSAMAYHNLSNGVGAISGALSPEKQKALAELARPTLVLAYAGTDRITLATTGEAFGITPANLFGLRMPLGMAGMLEDHPR